GERRPGGGAGGGGARRADDQVGADQPGWDREPAVGAQVGPRLAGSATPQAHRRPDGGQQCRGRWRHLRQAHGRTPDAVTRTEPLLPPVPLAVRLTGPVGSPCGLARRSVTGPWPAVTHRGETRSAAQRALAATRTRPVMSL